MAQPRIKLHEQLVEILGSNNVYFQKPTGPGSMKYPCIIYSRSDVDIKRSNNDIYQTMKKYTITVIDRNPDSDIPDRIMRLPYVDFDRHYKADGLSHDVYVLYF